MTDALAEAVVDALAGVWFTCHCGHKYSATTLGESTSFARFVTGPGETNPRSASNPEGVTSLRCHCRVVWWWHDGVWSDRHRYAAPMGHGHD